MDLHGRIMNIKAKPYDGTDAYTHYCHGHRDARRAAAELAMSVDMGAIAWAYGKCIALGLENRSMESAMMMDRLKLMLS